ncbi:hypothetical protein ANO14919_139250 [Xylariales sp. No.14919]|nr:hypothetical protein ANO14919_139250 [Xylariales sp. No.14919]
MPHFSVSWDRAMDRLCPGWLEELVNEDVREYSGLDVAMSVRSIEDLPLPPLPVALTSLEEQGIEDLSPLEISAIEAMYDASSASEASEGDVERSPSSDPSRILALLEPACTMRSRKHFDAHE